MKISPYLLGPCYCKDKRGEPDRNGIMCITNRIFERLDPCQEDEWCIGPKTPDQAEQFSSKTFCAKGGPILLNYKPYTLN